MIEDILVSRDMDLEGLEMPYFHRLLRLKFIVWNINGAGYGVGDGYGYGVGDGYGYGDGYGDGTG